MLYFDEIALIVMTDLNYSNDDLFDLSIRNYSKYPMYETFIEITKHVIPDMVRGLNKEENDINKNIHKNIVHLALVYRGYKPICWIPVSLPNFFDKLGLQMIRYKSKRNVWNRVFNYYVVWKYDEQNDRAKELAYCMKSYDEKSKNQHDEFIGVSLGYPQRDIDYFIKK